MAARLAKAAAGTTCWLWRRLSTGQVRQRRPFYESLTMKLNVFLATLSCALAGSAVLAPAARAAEPAPDVYVGGGLSFNHTHRLGERVDTALAAQGIGAATSADSSSTNTGLRLGYRVNPNLAFEASYDRVGTMNTQSTVATPGADTASGTWKAHGYGLHVLGIKPIDKQWSVYGRAGVEQWHTAMGTSSNAAGATNVAARSVNTGLALGVGTSYALTSSLDATGELMHYTKVGASDSTGRTGLNTVNVGLRYHFN
jgi:OmpA-OmpF porin, OOP family